MICIVKIQEYVLLCLKFILTLCITEFVSGHHVQGIHHFNVTSNKLINMHFLF